MDPANDISTLINDRRHASPSQRFQGYFRAEVVETNDPLNMGRVRFKCPDMHDSTLKAADLPWAEAAPNLGGARAGGIVSPTIGDIVWIAFEKQNPMAPIWVGFATPTRSKLYSYPQIHQSTPIPVNREGKPTSRPNDYDTTYLPKDGRPMSHGTIDRYGHLDLHCSVGFFPKKHEQAPPPPDHDAIGGTKYKQSSLSPEVNAPDRKYMARMTKYGMLMIQSDQGYYWKKNGELGEFTGDPIADEKYETQRWLKIQKLLNEGSPSGFDARRMLNLTRYGHRFEMRDTGWAQAGPVPSFSRQGEYGPPARLSEEETHDLRWVKLRTKGGWLFQAYDKGFHPQDDVYVKRSLLEECGLKSEQEDKYWGGDKDARWLRIAGRHGFKFVIDERGTDNVRAHDKELPRGNGFLFKGRRSPGSKGNPVVGDPRGFFWEFNENDQLNRTIWGSPLGIAMEINDRYQYAMIAASLGRGYAMKYQGLKENEFNRTPMVFLDAENSSHHLKLDHDNEYIRFKTRGGKGPAPDRYIVRTGVGGEEIQQGMEARDGQDGDGPWVELVDCQSRGFWFSKKNQIGIWRGKNDRQMYQWMDDNMRKIVLYNNEENGTIDLYAMGPIRLITQGNIDMQAGGRIGLKAGTNINLQAGDSKMTLGNGAMKTNGTFNANVINAFVNGVAPGRGGGKKSPGGIAIEELTPPTTPEFMSPTDRGRTFNGPYEECPQSEVEHKIPKPPEPQ